MDGRPILFVDVDGVINLFGFKPEQRPEAATFELIDGVPHAISHKAGELLRRLGESLDMVWASGWGRQANQVFPDLIQVGPLPEVSFDELGSRVNAFWKAGPIDEYAAGRPLAWIDDSFDRRCRDWAADRERSGMPTLLVPTVSELGLEEEHFLAVDSWASRIQVGGHKAGPLE